MPWIESVNEFWFRELKPDDWFSGRKAVDDLIRKHFGPLRETLKQSPPRLNELSTKGHVAAIIVYDQFSRNLFRDSGEAYATDSLALAISIHALDNRLDAVLGPHQRHFLYMPFMHSEDRGVQARSVELFRTLGSDLLSYAQHHKDIVDRFGRFPHRNRVLGRTSTAAEESFLGTDSQPY